LFQYLHPGQKPANITDAASGFAFEGAYQIKFRVRKDQVLPYWWNTAGTRGFLSASEAQRWYYNQPLSSDWFTTWASIEPHQISRVDHWCEQSGTWKRLPTHRRPQLHQKHLFRLSSEEEAHERKVVAMV